MRNGGDLHGMREVLNRAGALDIRKIVVVCPYDKATLESAALAGRKGIAEPILLGNERTIRERAEVFKVDLHGFAVIDSTEEEALERAAAMLLERSAHFIMKGSLGTGKLMHVLLDPRWAFRTERILSHVGMLEIPGSKRVFLMSDAGINIEPNFTRKIQILSNALHAARKIGIGDIKVAMLAAVEKVTLPAMPATLDAFLMKKYAETGYFGDCRIDGPFAFDNAIDPERALTKGIGGEVAGRANVVIVPNIETGNVIWKSITCLEDREAAGVVLGGASPVVVPSRSDDTDTKFLSIQFARLLLD